MAGVDASAQLVRQPAFVLHARPWRETSLLVEVLSAQEGRLGLIARGVHSPRQQALRAALQPWQWLGLTYLPRGELGHLRSAEPLDTAPRFHGQAVLAGFYANELLMRLTLRQDPLPGVYRAYAELRLQLGEGQALAWALRRFERDLLEEIGFGLLLTHDQHGAPVEPLGRYVIEAERGVRRVPDNIPLPSVSGQACLDLAADRQPTSSDVASLRLPLRSVMAHHLGSRGLQSWEMAAQLAVRPAAGDQSR